MKEEITVVHVYNLMELVSNLFISLSVILMKSNFNEVEISFDFFLLKKKQTHEQILSESNWGILT